MDSSLVLIPLSVTDGLNHPVLGLNKTNFRVFDRTEEQQVLHLSFEDAPLAVGLIFDTSGSMATKIAKARIAVSEFLKTANPEDEFFLVEFDNTARLTQPLTSEPGDIEMRLAATKPKGRTALFDAVALGLRELKRSSRPRKALVILSDGGDNCSRYTEGEMRDLVRESDASIYALGVFETGAARLTIDQLEAPDILNNLAEITGGRMFTVENPRDLPAVTAGIGLELHNRYVLGYVPSNLRHDGKYHRVQVKVIPPNGIATLHVDWRAGYHAPVQ